MKMVPVQQIKADGSTGGRTSLQINCSYTVVMRFLSLPQTDFVSLPSKETLAMASLSTGINERWCGCDSPRLTTHRLDFVVLTVSDAFSSLSLMVVAASLLQLPSPSTEASVAANPGCQVPPL